MSKLKTYGSKELEYNAQNSPQILQWIEPNSRVLEFGPAMGYMTRYMKHSLHCNITAVELSEEMAQYTKQYTEKIIIANLDTDRWEKEIDGLFDYILFSDVLEHLKDPEKVLKLATAFLKPDGSILTSIPNIGHSAIILSLLDGEFNYTQYGLLDSTHIHFFTRKSIVNMMENCNLSCQSEKNSITTPGSTELKKFFIKHLYSIPSILNKDDALVYQFVNQWKNKTEIKNNIKFKGEKLHFFRKILAILDDTNDFIEFRYNYKFKLPKWLRKIIR